MRGNKKGEFVSPSLHQWTRPVTRTLLLWSLAWLSGGVEAASLAVVYPDVDGPYQEVFKTIIDGIESDAGISVTAYALKKGENSRQAMDWLTAQKPDAVIALGRRGYNLAKTLSLDMPMVVGATLMTPDGLSGISLVGDPEQFFKHLVTLSPPVKRVYAVYNPDNTGWLIDRARSMATQYGIDLRVSAAKDEREATQLYVDILKKVRPGKDAIWLPLDNVVPDEALLPLLLAAAWEKQLVIFSNNPSHVKKGALFSLYPDHRALGVKLAEMALALHADKGKKPVVLPLAELKVAINLRTASHLGLVYTARQQQQFSLIYPSRR